MEGKAMEIISGEGEKEKEAGKPPVLSQGLGSSKGERNPVEFPKPYSLQSDAASVGNSVIVGSY